jgi:secondary thiamine-phosphate synthase enzyme
VSVKLVIKSRSRSEMINITHFVQDEISRSGITDGVCIVYVPHTTAGITINEGADPSVCDDILNKLTRLVPKNENYSHSEGNSDSHIKASLMGSSVTVIIANNSLVLGTWQKIFFCEFDGPRTRDIYIKFLKDN